MKDTATVILLVIIVSMYGYAIGYTLGAIVKALIVKNKDNERKDDK